MKIKKILLCLACGTAITGLASCSKTVSNSAYGADIGGAYDTYIYCATVTQNGAKMTSVEIEEVPMVSKWARIASTEGATEGKDFIIVENVDDGNGGTETVNFAKHIRIGTTTWTATVRGEDNSPASGYNSEKSVVYTLDTSMKAKSETDGDLITYISAETETGRYKLGSRFKWYYEALVKNDVKILKEASRTENSSLTNGYSFTYEDESKGWDANYSKSSIQRSKWDSDWKTGIEGLEAYCVNTLKKLNYQRRVADSDNENHYTIKLKAENNTYYYNPNYQAGFEWNEADDDNFVGYSEITGVTSPTFALASVTSLFTGINLAYAAGEYTSQR